LPKNLGPWRQKRLEIRMTYITVRPYLSAMFNPFCPFI
jgi:hypothetical protein